MKEVGRERKRKKNWIFRVNELPFFDQGGTPASFPSTLLFYWSSGKAAVNGVLFLLFCKLTAKEMLQRPFLYVIQELHI